MTHLSDIVQALEDEDKTVVMLQPGEDAPEGSLTLGEFVMLVDNGTDQAVIDAGWDSSGVYVDVRMFRNQQWVPGNVTDVLGLISVRPESSQDAAEGSDEE